MRVLREAHYTAFTLNELNLPCLPLRAAETAARVAWYTIYVFRTTEEGTSHHEELAATAHIARPNAFVAKEKDRDLGVVVEGLLFENDIPQVTFIPGDRYRCLSSVLRIFLDSERTESGLPKGFPGRSQRQEPL